MLDDLSEDSSLDLDSDSTTNNPLPSSSNTGLQRLGLTDDHSPTPNGEAGEENKDNDTEDDIDAEIEIMVNLLQEDILAGMAPKETDNLLTPREITTPMEAVVTSATTMTGSKDAMEIDSDDELDGFPMLVAHCCQSKKTKQGEKNNTSKPPPLPSLPKTTHPSTTQTTTSPLQKTKQLYYISCPACKPFF